MAEQDPSTTVPENLPKPRYKRTLLIISLVTVASVAFLACVAIPPLMYAKHIGWAIVDDPGAWNNFGTFVGGVVTPLLSTLAFFGLLYTVFLQQQQLTLARTAKIDTDRALQEQLSLARKSKEDSDAALKQQARADREEAARSTFFELIRLHHEITNGLSIVNGHSVRTGRAVIRGFMFDIFVPEYMRQSGGTTDILEFDKKFCTRIFKNEGERFSHYFRNLRQILLYIESSPYKDREQLRLIVRAQLSDLELLMIFYFGLSRSFGCPMKLNAEISGLFQGFDLHQIYDQASLKAYNPFAWGYLVIPYKPHW